MKKNTIFRGFVLASAVALVLPLASCSEDIMDKINENPNNPQTTPAKFILADVGVGTAVSTVGADLSIYASIYSELEAGVSDQMYQAETRGSEPILATTYNNSWVNVYGNIKNAKIAIDKCLNDPLDKGNDVTLAIGRILLAYNGAVMTDLFGDTPFSEVGIMNEDGTPKYMQPKIDKQEDIYKAVNQLLDQAITTLSTAGVSDHGGAGAIGNKDFIYGGDAGKWLKAAYALKARYAMRLLNRATDKTAALNNILDYVSKSFTGADDEMTLAVFDGDNQVNPYATFFYSRESMGASESLVKKLKERNDPRGNILFDTTLDKVNAAPNGTLTEQRYVYSYSAYGEAYAAPVYLFSYHELMFLKAEALVRLGKTEDAKLVLKSAVEAAFASAEKDLGKSVETDAATYFDSSIASLYDANPLKETMIQKYISCYGGGGEAIEAYNDIRRLQGEGKGDLIKLENPENAKGKFPYRYTYGNTDVLANQAIKAVFGDGQYVYTEKVWWAGGTK